MSSRHSQMCGNAITTCHLLPPSDDVGILLGLPGQSHSSLKKMFDVLGKLSLIWKSRFKTTRLSQAAYKYDNSETPIIRTAVKAGKTAQEILEEYQPFKEQLAEIISAVALVPPEKKDDEDEAMEKKAHHVGSSLYVSIFCWLDK